jgi:hypothetical protein
LFVGVSALASILTGVSLIEGISLGVGVDLSVCMMVNSAGVGSLDDCIFEVLVSLQANSKKRDVVNSA